jgi:hypothetical protein
VDVRQAIIALWRFVTALAIAEERNAELARSREELAQVQRLEAIGQLTGHLVDLSFIDL